MTMEIAGRSVVVPGDATRERQSKCRTRTSRDQAIGIVDAFKPTSGHGAPPNLLRCELAAVGYREIRLDRLTGSDAYLAILASPSLANRTPLEETVPCN
jgi:hypothetical protein